MNNELYYGMLETMKQTVTTTFNSILTSIWIWIMSRVDDPTRVLELVNKRRTKRKISRGSERGMENGEKQKRKLERLWTFRTTNSGQFRAIGVKRTG
jgi:hypothetical protein